MILSKIKRAMTETKGVVEILSDDVPASLVIDGSDVTGLPDDYVIAIGSVIIAPANNYICFSVSDQGESTFIEKTTS